MQEAASRCVTHLSLLGCHEGLSPVLKADQFVKIMAQMRAVLAQKYRAQVECTGRRRRWCRAGWMRCGRSDGVQALCTLSDSSAPRLTKLVPLLAKARLVISVEGSCALRSIRPPPDTYRQSCLAIIWGLGGMTTPVEAAVPNLPADPEIDSGTYKHTHQGCLRWSGLWRQNCSFAAHHNPEALVIVARHMHASGKWPPGQAWRNMWTCTQQRAPEPCFGCHVFPNAGACSKGCKLCPNLRTTVVATCSCIAKCTPATSTNIAVHGATAHTPCCNTQSNEEQRDVRRQGTVMRCSLSCCLGITLFLVALSAHPTQAYFTSTVMSNSIQAESPC